MLASRARPACNLLEPGSCHRICFSARYSLRRNSQKSFSSGLVPAQYSSTVTLLNRASRHLAASARPESPSAFHIHVHNLFSGARQHTGHSGQQPTSASATDVPTVGSSVNSSSNGNGKQSEMQQQPAPSYPQGWQDVFQKGVAISVWQNSSDEASNWTHFMRRKNYFGQRDYVEAFHQSNDFWNKYEEDIQLVKSLGCNSFRFSFEWSRIEPQPGQIDRAAIAKFHKILDSIQAAGLIPNVTLHHFTHPQWFEARGGWANPDNITAFVNYGTLMFQEFGVRIPIWATFNEPSCFCLCGFIMGLWAPGQRGRVGKAGKILGNMLKAHVQVYWKLKAMPCGDAAQIGIVHQHIRFVPNCNPIAGLIVRPVCHWMTYWFATQQMLEFFTSGHFKWVTPWRQTVAEFHIPEAVGALDWWGINYYSRPAINSRFQLVGLDDSEPLTGMGMPLVPGDLHYHLMDAHRRLQVPIIVSETGVSDERHVLRAQCISTYYNEILRAISDGADVRGVYYWTLMDNIEWHHGFNQHFGLYEWRPPTNGNGANNRPSDGNQLILRQGSKTLVDLHAAWPKTWQEMRQFARQRFQNPETRVQNPVAAGLGYCLGAAGIPGEQQQQLKREAEEADKQQAGSGVKEPLLGSEPGRISDVV